MLTDHINIDREDNVVSPIKLQFSYNPFDSLVQFELSDGHGEACGSAINAWPKSRPVDCLTYDADEEILTLEIDGDETEIEDISLEQFNELLFASDINAYIDDQDW